MTRFQVGIVWIGMSVLGAGTGSLFAQGSSWDALQKERQLSRGSRVFVVTDAEPQVRQPCRVATIDADRLVCSERFGKRRTEYRREDVLAVIEPAYHEHLLRFWLKGTLAGVGLIAAGAVLSGPVAVVAIVAGAVVIYLATMSVGWSNGSYPETILYFQPGRALTFPLYR